MQARLSKIDDLTRPDHTFLVPEYLCSYLGESKVKSDAEYDDRVPGILAAFAASRPVDVRELVYMTRNVEQSHLAESRVSVEELVSSMAIDESQAEPPPSAFGIFDDVLTTGRHFKAVQCILNARFPGVPTVALFIARRAPQSILPTAPFELRACA